VARAARARLAAAAGSAAAAAAAGAERAAALAALAAAHGAAAAAWPGEYLDRLTPDAAMVVGQGFGMLVAVAVWFATMPFADSGGERAVAVAALPCADSGGERALALRPAGHVARCLPPPPPPPPPQRKPTTRAAVLALPAPAVRSPPLAPCLAMPGCVRLSLTLWSSAGCASLRWLGTRGCRASVGVWRSTQLAGKHAA